MVLPEFRPMRPDGLAAFCDRSLNPAQLQEQLAVFLAAGSVLPEWCWTATGAGGAVLARHYWWGLRGSGKPTVVTSVTADDQAAAAGLLVHARDRLGVKEARCEVIVPHGQGDPSAVRADLVALLTAAGFGLEVSRVRVEWVPAAGVPPAAGRLTMRPARQFGEVGLFREEGVNELPAHATRVLAGTGASRIRADTDRANIPMRAAFARAGYQEFAWRDDYGWRREGSRAGHELAAGASGGGAGQSAGVAAGAGQSGGGPAGAGQSGGGPAGAGQSGESGTARLMTPRLRLTPLTVPDADEMVLVLSGARLYEFIGGTAPSTDELRAQYGRLVVGRSPDGSQVWHNWIVRTLNGAAVGTVQATVTDSGTRAEVAWVIGQPYWGQGYASEAVTGVVSWLARTGVGEVMAHIHPGHRASQAVARRAGLRPADVFQDGEQRWTRRFGRVPQ